MRAANTQPAGADPVGDASAQHVAGEIAQRDQGQRQRQRAEGNAVGALQKRGQIDRQGPEAHALRGAGRQQRQQPRLRQRRQPGLPAVRMRRALAGPAEPRTTPRRRSERPPHRAPRSRRASRPRRRPAVTTGTPTTSDRDCPVITQLSARPRAAGGNVVGDRGEHDAHEGAPAHAGHQLPDHQLRVGVRSREAQSRQAEQRDPGDQDRASPQPVGQGAGDRGRRRPTSPPGSRTDWPPPAGCWRGRWRWRSGTEPWPSRST